ncbi:MAG TPA: enolase C-terminal domain-like protein [Marmoricola sp.]|nr:enolase C-terminal domain-like protein [Marmoricola sp.]
MTPEPRGAPAQERVDRVAVGAFTIPTDEPEADGTFAWDSTTMVLVEAVSGGLTGIGWSYAPAACADLARDLLAPLVAGTPVAEPGRSWGAMVDAVRNVGRAGVAAAAISAVDLALWDLHARTLGVPLHQLLGPRRDAVPVYGSGGFTTYDEARLERQLQEWLAAGIGHVKIKIGEDHGRCVPRDLARTRQVRRTVGDEVGVMVDANGGYREQQALEVARALEQLGVEWFEEPVTSDDLPGLHRLRERTRLEVAAGEYGYDLAYFHRMCAADAVDCLQVDVTRCGGITEWLRIAAVAAACHLDVSAHCAPNAGLAVACATPNFRHQEWFHDHVRIESMLFDGAATAAGGVARPAAAPGTGLTFKHADAERFRVR